MVYNFCEYALNNGAVIKPLLINSKDLKGPSLSNPSIFVDNDNIYCVLRNLNYVLYHAEKCKYEHQWGKLVYVHREDDVTLTTFNFVGKLDENLDLIEYSHVDTTALDVKPLWEFVGLEDCRIVKWNDKTYLSGVRRDTTPTGVGRMELSEIVQHDGQWKEISRFRIPVPNGDNTYCEKNWMPIIDQPYRYVKWSNPIEVVEVDPETKSSKTVFLGKTKYAEKDWRGSSQVIPYKDGGHICYVHETDLWFDECERKNAKYRNRFLVWDKDWNLINVSPLFSFFNCEVEFGCGMSEYKDGYLITFGVQDNCAFVMYITHDVLEKFVSDGI